MCISNLWVIFSLTRTGKKIYISKFYDYLLAELGRLSFAFVSAFCFVESFLSSITAGVSDRIFCNPFSNNQAAIKLTFWATYKINISLCRVRLMMFNATLYNISVISWQSILLVEETIVPGENCRPAARH